ncbi:MAG: hypothetical protein KDM91_05585 [Verrucomicrobiae bacterium]|nr:hypothetical protein [Verrucomicrobiae bacterium]
MKTRPTLTAANRRRRAYVSLPIVGGLAVIVLAGTTYIYHRNTRALEMQGRVQARMDDLHREDGMLRAVLHELPKVLVSSMREGSALDRERHSWRAVFATALEDSAAGAIAPEELGIDGGRAWVSGNTGASALLGIDELVSPLVPNRFDFLNPGTVDQTELLFDRSLGMKLPAPLAPAEVEGFSEGEYPLLSPAKTLVAGWENGVALEPGAFPNYNLIDRPRVKLDGLPGTGGKFVARRNWWAFGVNFDRFEGRGATPGSRSRRFLLSLYEVPVRAPRRRGFDLLERLDSGMAAADLIIRDEDGFPRRATSAPWSIRAARLALPAGSEFLHLAEEEGVDITRISPVGWNAYSTGAGQCAMRLRILELKSPDEPVPTALALDFRATGEKEWGRIELRRGQNWPESGAGAADLPFQTRRLEDGREALVVMPPKLPAFLNSLPEAAGSEVNRSLCVLADESVASLAEGIVVRVAESADLTVFPEGFSLVTPLGLQFDGSVNTHASEGTPQGWPENLPCHPAVSFFAGEIDFAPAPGGIRIEGEVHEMGSGDYTVPVDDEGNPLPAGAKWKSRGVSVHTPPLEHPAQLPPVFFKDWLLTLEEIR